MPILVEREREQQQLREFQQRAFAGHGSLALIYRKTGVTTRAAAIHWVIGHNLTSDADLEFPG